MPDNDISAQARVSMPVYAVETFSELANDFPVQVLDCSSNDYVHHGPIPRS